MSKRTVETNDDEFAFTRKVTPDGEYRNNKEITAIAENGSVYAGKWLRDQMDSSEGVTVGYWENELEADYLPVEISPDNTLRHGLIVGATGYGKSSVLTNMARQFSQRDAGILLVDPKGTASKQLKQRLPLQGRTVFEIGRSQSNSEIQAVSLLTPTRKRYDEDFEAEVDVIIETVIRAVRDDSYWGPTSDSLARAAVRCIVELNANQDKSEQVGFQRLFDLLTDEVVRTETLEEYKKRCSNEDVVSTIEEYAGTEDAEPLARRFKSLAVEANEMIRPDAPNIGHHVESNSVILLQPPIESDNAIASLIAERVWHHNKLNRDNEFYICVDELEQLHYPFMDIGNKLAKGRGFNTGLYMTSQNLDLNEELLGHLFGNIANMVLLNPGEQSVANRISRHLSELGSNEQLSLERFEAIFRTTVNGESVQKRIRIAPIYPPLR